MAEGREAAETRAAFLHLANHVIEHFDAEEALVALHQAQAETAQFMLDWLRKHLSGPDLAMAAFLRERLGKPVR